MSDRSWWKSQGTVLTTKPDKIWNLPQSGTNKLYQPKLFSNGRNCVLWSLFRRLYLLTWYRFFSFYILHIFSAVLSPVNECWSTNATKHCYWLANAKYCRPRPSANNRFEYGPKPNQKTTKMANSMRLLQQNHVQRRKNCFWWWWWNLHAIRFTITESEFEMRIWFQNLPFHVSINQLRTNYYLLCLMFRLL